MTPIVSPTQLTSVATMKSFTFAAVAASMAITVSANCHADNCARAVTGTRLGETFVASAKADCTSIMTHTSTAPAVYVP